MTFSISDCYCCIWCSYSTKVVVTYLGFANGFHLRGCSLWQMLSEHMELGCADWLSLRQHSRCMKKDREKVRAVKQNVHLRKASDKLVTWCDLSDQWAHWAHSGRNYCRCCHWGNRSNSLTCSYGNHLSRGSSSCHSPLLCMDHLCSSCTCRLH